MSDNDWEKTTIFETTARGTLRMTATVPGDRDGPQLHLHERTTEKITVLTGAVDVVFRERRVRLETGMGLVIPPGTPHSFSTRGLDDPRLQMELDPAGEMEGLFRAMAQARRTGGSELLAVARSTEAGADFLYASGPTWFQRGLFRLLAWASAKFETA